MEGRTTTRLLAAAAMLLAAALPAFALEDWFEKGAAALRQGQYSEAISAFNKAIERDPEHVGAHNSRGAAWHKMGVYERAIRDYTTAIHLRPAHAGAYNNRGVAWYQKGDTVRALADYDRALELDPGYVSALENRASAWRRLGHFDRAVADLRRAEGIEPSYGIYLQLAWILAACPDPASRNGPAAEDYARKATALQTDPESLGALAAAYAEQGRFEDAARLENQILHELEGRGDARTLEVHRQRLRSYRARMPLGKTYLAGYGSSPAPPSRNSERPKPPEVQNPAAEEAATTAPQPAPAPAAAPPEAPPSAPAPAGRAPEPAAAAPIPAPPEAEETAPPPPFTVQVASFRDPDTAFREAMRLRESGDPAFVSLARLPSRGGDWHRLFLGRFATRQEASRTADVLKAGHYRFARVVSMPYAVEVRVEGAGEALRQARRLLRLRHLMAYPESGAPADGPVRMLVGAFASPEEAAVTAERLRQDGLQADIVPPPAGGGR